MSRFANYLAIDEDCEVHLVLLSSHELFFPVQNKVRINFSTADSQRSSISALYGFMTLRKTLKSIRPDVVLSFGSMYNSFLLLAALGLGLRVYVSDRSNPYRNTILSFRRDPIMRHDGPLHYFLKKWLYKKSAGILVQTECARKIENDFLNHPNIVLVPNPVRQVEIPETSYRENVILNVGRFVQTKNQVELIEIFSEIRIEGWSLVLIGDGPTKELAERRARDLGLGDSVMFLGARSDIEGYLATSEIFAFTSLSEGFPNALLEGMAAELACIAYDCIAGPSELIEDGYNGFLVPMRGRALFSEKLTRLMSDAGLREAFRERGKKSIGRFEEPHVFSQLKRELMGT